MKHTIEEMIDFIKRALFISERQTGKRGEMLRDILEILDKVKDGRLHE